MLGRPFGATCSRNLLLFVVLSVAVMAGQSQPPSLTESGIHGFITGTAGAPIRGAEVSVFQDGEPAGTMTVNNRSGEYAHGLEPGDYEVKVTAEGHLPANATVTIPPRTWVTLNFTLTRQGPPPAIPSSGIMGFITDTAVVPVRQANISIFQDGQPAGFVSFNDSPAIKNPSGGYSHWLEPGDYEVKVTAEGYLPANATVTIPPKTWVTQNFTLRAQPPAIPGGLRGFITDSAGAPIRQATISIFQDGESARAMTIDSPTGEYHIWLGPGHYEVEVVAGGYLPANATVTIPPKTWVTQNFTLRPAEPLPDTTPTRPRFSAETLGLPGALAVAALVALGLGLRQRG